jgi:hypothetical protein
MSLINVMNQVFRTALLAAAFMITARHAVAEEWRGLIPLKSTRADVVRVFNQCVDNKTYCEFTRDKEDIVIMFASDENCNKVPIGTVLSIQRELQNDTTFAALGLDKRRFKSFNPGRPLHTYRGFIDEKTGLLLKTYLGRVFQIYYIAAAEDRQLCAKYYGDPRQFVNVFSHTSLQSSNSNVLRPTQSPAKRFKLWRAMLRRGSDTGWSGTAPAASLLKAQRSGASFWIPLVSRVK